jgi:hypothetical protein
MHDNELMCWIATRTKWTQLEVCYASIMDNPQLGWDQSLMGLPLNKASNEKLCVYKSVI